MSKIGINVNSCSFVLTTKKFRKVPVFIFEILKINDFCYKKKKKKKKKLNYISNLKKI